MNGILFLDDCARRCRTFLRREPSATIVRTAARCIEALKSRSWEEVHLDHDLNGATYVDSADDDCGMEVVRWIALNNPDVRTFVVHTCNDKAGPIMCRALTEAGYHVIYAPFRHEDNLPF